MSHELYPEDEGVDLISLYEDKPCMECHKVKSDCAWRNITVSNGIWIAPGTMFTIKFIRICDSCFDTYNCQYQWM